ncbi:MAG: hypothetical protein ACREI7_09030, partial [Myxococcota bacterium]
MLPHGSYAAELEFYVEDLGSPPLDVLRWAGSPTWSWSRASSDIAVLQDAARIHAVMRGGRFAVDRL